MARSIYSVRFIFGALGTVDGLTRTYTVPTGKVAVVRCVGFDVLAGPATVDISLTPTPGSSAYRWLRYSLAATDVITLWEGRVVANAGDSLKVTNRTGGATSVASYVSGYLLTV